MKLGEWESALQVFGEAINCENLNTDDFVI
jgi:hypothetical protein